MSELTILGIFVADISFSGDKIPKITFIINKQLQRLHVYQMDHIR